MRDKIKSSEKQQVENMKKYIVFSNKKRVTTMLRYMGYYRLSRYGEFLVGTKNSKCHVNILDKLYLLDRNLRAILFEYCKIVEIQLKKHIVEVMMASCNDPLFYLDLSCYTTSRGLSDKNERSKAQKVFKTFSKKIVDLEKKLRSNTTKYPEFKEYRNKKKYAKGSVPCWAAFTQFDLGTINYIYFYLNGKYRKWIIQNGYKKRKVNKATTKEFDTWIDSIRNLRNSCVHYNRLIGTLSTVVLCESKTNDKLEKNNDLFSRLYALKKLLDEANYKQMFQQLKMAIVKSNIDVVELKILPEEWEKKLEDIASFAD